MSEDSFLRAQAHTHHLGRLIRELSGVLDFCSFVHYSFFPIWAGLRDACRRTNSPRQSSLPVNREQEAESLSVVEAAG